ncbi:MAG TPA: DUF2950 domain-containing protein [Burkholderiales bacterium]|nr:DUF2950 domain-containing protein [Burkholderiales bacterium]
MNTEMCGKFEMAAIRSSRFATPRRALIAALLAAGIAAGTAALAAETKHKTFATPEDAAAAFIAATKSGDAQAMRDVLGPGSASIVQSGDAVSDRRGRERFVQAYGEANKLVRQGDAKATLLVGKDEWPLPIPIVKDAAGWRFDTKQGREEILNRRIGRNELSAMQAVLAYVDAQREYYLRNPQGDKLFHYAQKFTSARRNRDGLYFATKAGEKPSPLGPLYASAKAEGYTKGDDSYHGYHYRILRGQGPSASGGAYDYVAQGKMLGGFALVAWPATYGNSGVMTFIVNHDGVIYEKDLGPDTEAAARKITRYNPDKSWKRP